MSACLTARGVVRRTHAGGAVELDLLPRSGCEGCRGACLWRRLGAEPPLLLPALERLAAGTEVTVSLPERFVLRTALLMHGLPWAALLAGAALGAAATGSDAGAGIGALLALAAALAATRRLRRRFERAARAELVLETLE